MSGMVRCHPCWHRVGSGMVRVILGRSVALPWWYRGQIRVSVLAACWLHVDPCSSVMVPFLVRGYDVLRSSRDSISPRITPDQDIFWSGCSGVLRVGSGFGVIEALVYFIDNRCWLCWRLNRRVCFMLTVEHPNGLTVQGSYLHCS